MMKETGQTGITGMGVILTEVVLVLAAGVLWWFIHDTPFLKSAWFPWVAVMFPITSLAVPLVLTIRNKKRIGIHIGGHRAQQTGRPKQLTP